MRTGCQWIRDALQPIRVSSTGLINRFVAVSHCFQEPNKLVLLAIGAAVKLRICLGEAINLGAAAMNVVLFHILVGLL
jgi:hypothetical protein